MLQFGSAALLALPGQQCCTAQCNYEEVRLPCNLLGQGLIQSDVSLLELHLNTTGHLLVTYTREAAIFSLAVINTLQ